MTGDLYVGIPLDALSDPRHYDPAPGELTPADLDAATVLWEAEQQRRARAALGRVDVAGDLARWVEDMRAVQESAGWHGGAS